VNPIHKFVGIFDSGVGGLSVLAECKRLLPHENFVYLMDKENFPYGSKSDEFIEKRVFALSEKLLNEHSCKAIVVACNTATNVGIQMLRKKYNIPFVGLEPAIKPALETIKDGKVVLLTTPVTIRQKKFQDLLSRFDSKNLIILPQRDLASLIEDNINTSGTLSSVLDFKISSKRQTPAIFFDYPEKIYPHIEKILTPYADAKGVVLGCTHYVFINELIERFFLERGKTVQIFDGNIGAAKRLKSLLE